MIWENTIETCTLQYVKWMTGADSMHYTRNSKLVLWDNPEGWGGEAGGRSSGRWDTYTHMADSCQFSSVQFCRSVVSDSLWPHESHHARPPCPSPTPAVHSDSCPSSQWCHPAISSSVIPFSSCPQSLPALESFPMSQHFAWGRQSIGVSALASVLPNKSQG